MSNTVDAIFPDTAHAGHGGKLEIELGRRLGMLWTGRKVLGEGVALFMLLHSSIEKYLHYFTGYQ